MAWITARAPTSSDKGFSVKTLNGRVCRDEGGGGGYPQVLRVLGGPLFSNVTNMGPQYRSWPKCHARFRVGKIVILSVADSTKKDFAGIVLHHTVFAAHLPLFLMTKKSLCHGASVATQPLNS